MYIKECSDPIAPHNFHLYPMLCKSGSHGSNCSSSPSSSFSSALPLAPSASQSYYPVWLAITISGIAIYARDLCSVSTLNATHHSQLSTINLKTRISLFPWSDIGKLSFEKKKFEIRSTGTHNRKFAYIAQSEEVARHLLWFCRASHQFHLMVNTKMKEMLKREAEISRRKYREACVSSGSSSSSGCSSSGLTDGQWHPCPSGSTSIKSTSPVALQSAKVSRPPSSNIGRLVAVSNVDGVCTQIVGANEERQNSVTSDLDVSASCSPCSGIGTRPLEPQVIIRHRLTCAQPKDHADQRSSVISNASSNTTSGIVSDKHEDCNGELDNSDMDLLSLKTSVIDDRPHRMVSNHQHHPHYNRRHCGASPQPVVSLESLALSEPIQSLPSHRSRPHQSSMNVMHKRGQNARLGQMSDPLNLTVAKQHSVSISNITITDCAPSEPTMPTNSCAPSELLSFNTDSASETDDSSNKMSSNSSQHLSSLAPPVLVNGEKCSKILLLNVNQPSKNNARKPLCKQYSSTDFTDCDESLVDDDVDCVFDQHQVSIPIKHLSKPTTGTMNRNKSSATVLSTILKPEAERLLSQGIEANEAEVMISHQMMKNQTLDDDKQWAELKEFEQAEKEKIILNSLINGMPPKMVTSDLDDSEDDSDSSSSSSEDENDDLNDLDLPPGYLKKCYSPTLHEKNYIGLNSQYRKSTPIYENVNQTVTSSSGSVDSGSHHPIGLLPLAPAISCGHFPLSSVLPSATPVRHRPGMRIGVSSLNRPYSSYIRTNQTISGGGQPQPFLGSNLLNAFTVAGSEPNLSTLNLSSKPIRRDSAYTFGVEDQDRVSCPFDSGVKYHVPTSDDNNNISPAQQCTFSEAPILHKFPLGMAQSVECISKKTVPTSHQISSVSKS